MFPLEVVADRAAGEMTVRWDDGHSSRYALPAVRWACPCAECAGEWGRPGKLATLTRLPDDELELAGVQTVGTYAIMPVWRSGHSSGILSFEYLRSLCPCGECSSSNP